MCKVSTNGNYFVPSALDRLKKAANLKPVKKVVTLRDGSAFEFWRTPLTMAERERAQKGTKDDVNAFALQLLVLKAQDANGERLFSNGQMAELKHDVRDADLQALMLAVIEEDSDEALDPKGSKLS
jgi:hypothetical protein|tara:strand:+ start:4074 stop:4451 length:378 start_codon:yes stop_codon:yes gene_type:complete